LKVVALLFGLYLGHKILSLPYECDSRVLGPKEGNHQLTSY
jgi:hypothetical protein